MCLTFLKLRLTLTPQWSGRITQPVFACVYVCMYVCMHCIKKNNEEMEMLEHLEQSLGSSNQDIVRECQTCMYVRMHIYITMYVCMYEWCTCTSLQA